MPYLQWKLIVIELPVTFLSFGCLYLGILGFKSEQFFGRWIYLCRRPPLFVCIVYSLPSNIFYPILYWVLLSFYRPPEDRTKLALNLHSWKMIYLNIIGLFLSCFWCTTFIFLSLRCVFDGRRIKYRISPFWIGIACVFHTYFLVFS